MDVFGLRRWWSLMHIATFASWRAGGASEDCRRARVSRPTSCRSFGRSKPPGSQACGSAPDETHVPCATSSPRPLRPCRTQRKSVEDFLNGGHWQLVKEFVEIESGKKTDRQRPVLAEAIIACRLYGAKLVIAKLDRLSRNAHFLLGLKEAGVDFVAADLPTANRLTVGIMAMVAEEEGRMISERTKAALAAARRRGVQLGGYNKNPKLTAQARAAGQQANARIAAGRRYVTTGYRSGPK